LEEDDADEVIGLFQIHAMRWRRDGMETLYGVGSRLTPESQRTASARSSSTHEFTLPRLSDRNRTSDQMVGGSKPSGRATF
jgi:hypothetical protein